MWCKYDFEMILTEFLVTYKYGGIHPRKQLNIAYGSIKVGFLNVLSFGLNDVN